MSMTPSLQNHTETVPRAPAGIGDSAAVEFRSILFGDFDRETSQNAVEPPDFFRDLNLDQVVDAVVAGRDEYDLKPFFYTRLTDLAAIAYRHEVMRDLENKAVFQSVKTFSDRMHSVREHLKAAEKLSYKYEQEGWFLDAAEIYGDAIEDLRRELDQGVAASRGLTTFREYLGRYAASDRVHALREETKKLRADLAAIRYCLLIREDSYTVRHYDSEIDYSASVEETFAKFKQGAVKSYLAKLPESSSLNHIEAQILEGVARLHPDVFGALDEFRTRHRDFAEKTIADFDREIQFYLAWLEHAESLKRAGLTFCYPRVSDTDKEIVSRESFDLALADKLVRERAPVVCNDFVLHGNERIIVVTGPNQGGKTTFARTFGQLHYLASLGCPVPGTEARLFLFDRLSVHFEREENIENLRGKLQDDLVRIHGILDQATPNSIVVINEIFSSTTVKDAVFLGRKIMERLSQLDLLCVCVTFLDELASLNEKTVSMVAAVVPDNPTLRTFRIERKPADGMSYAVAIAEKYRLTYEHLKKRIKS